nr:GphQ [Archangium violaceum Cb vi76]
MEPHFTLHGLEVDYQSEGLEVGASLLRGGVFVYGSRYRRGERVRGV